MTRTNNNSNEIRDWGDWVTKYAQMWLDNDEWFQLTVLPAYFAALAEKSRASASELSDIIRDYVIENRPDIEPSLYDDLLNAMLTEIDYTQLAADYIDTANE